MIHFTVQQAYQAIPESVKDGMTGASIAGALSAAFGFITGLFGALGAIASFVWLMLRLYEMKTVQEWLAKRRSQ